MTGKQLGAIDADQSDSEALRRALRGDLEASGYTLDGVAAALGPVAAESLEREELLPARLALGCGADIRGADAQDRQSHEVGASPLGVMLRLFRLGEPVTRAQVEAAFPRAGVSTLASLGWVTAQGTGDDDEVRGAVGLLAYSSQEADGDRDWWIASDLGVGARGRALPEDYVLGVSRASRTLAQVTVRRPDVSVLDLGTGCGIQALHAAQHARRVVATDVSPRALEFARMNAMLAGVEVDLRRGSMFDPVSERFDLVVSNPPFVITPRSGAVSEYTYRDGGRRGDDLVHALVAGVGEHLEPGGVAQLLGNWEHVRGQEWDERLHGWLEESGLDGWVVQREVLDPAEYAEMWLRDGGTGRGGGEAEVRARDDAYEAWLRDFAERGVEAVGFGFITLRRPAGHSRERWRRVEEATGAVRQPLGPVIGEVLAAVDHLADLDARDVSVLEERWRVAPDVTDERYFTPGEPQPRVILLRAGGGFGRTVRCDTALSAFVGACDGELTGGQIVGALGALLEVAADDLAAELVPQVRGLITDGLLLPA
ncbi:DUF7059 domain-containing protein [Serinibacter salmoneus]|uniref:Methyltransferase family protein n=1 Tax=Serinibacter salmoneus TaxID=556530 RepID=A0A2A9D360_9MICO|nr:methyltransferase [Serinibacter salmoneus]PFG20685.1 methyltransferase family protein [Serinibacter salmoneus]